jgi:hypothetical protein
VSGRSDRPGEGALASILPMLRKLIPRLASNFDGEILATTRAISRTLQGVGLDWNDFAQIVTTPRAPAPAPPPPPQQPRWSASDYAYSAHSGGWGGLQRDRERINWLLCDTGGLRPKELDFLHSIRSRLSGGRGLSEKQAAWLDAIHARVARETHR